MRTNSGQSQEWQSENEAFLIQTEQKTKKKRTKKTFESNQSHLANPDG